MNLQRIRLKLILYPYALIVGITGLTPGLRAQDTTLVTLAGCYAKAVQNYPLLQNKVLIQDASSARIKNILTSYLPQFSLNGQATYQSDVTSINLPPQLGFSVPGSPKDQEKISLDVQQVLYDGGISRARKNLESISSKTDMQQIDIDLVKIKENVNNTYFYILVLNQNEKLLKHTLTVINDRLSTIRSSVNNGVFVSSDRDAMEAEQLKTMQQLSEIQNNRHAAMMVMNILTGEQYTDSTELTIPEIVLNDSLTGTRPEYGYFDLQQQKLDAAARLGNSGLMPKFYAFGQLGYGKPGLNMLSDQFNHYYLVGAGLKWSFWDWGSNRRDKQVYSIQKEQIQNQKSNFDKNLNVDLQNKMTSIENLQNAIESDKKIVELRSHVTQTAESQLQNGVITSTEYLSVLNNETSARISLETHKIQLLQARANYLLSKGNL